MAAEVLPQPLEEPGGQQGPPRSMLLALAESRLGPVPLPLPTAQPSCWLGCASWRRASSLDMVQPHRHRPLCWKEIQGFRWAPQWMLLDRHRPDCENERRRLLPRAAKERGISTIWGEEVQRLFQNLSFRL